MWPVPPIHKSSAEHRWRAGLSRAERTGGRGLRRTRRRPQENKRARSLEPGSCVRGRELRRAGCSAAGAAPGRGGGSDGASCAAQCLEGGAALERQAPGSGEGASRAAAERLRTPAGFRGPRQQGASAQRPGAGFLRSGGAGSRAIYASAHLRAGRRPWLAIRSGREVV